MATRSTKKSAANKVNKLLLQREAALQKVAQAEVNLAQYRAELSRLRAELLRVDPETALRIAADRW